MNFRNAHERARRVSLKLAVAFWLGLPLGALFYYAIFRLLLTPFSDPPRLLEHILWFLVAMILCTTFSAYLDALDRFRRKTAVELAQLFGASHPDKWNLKETRLQNIVSEMSAATNLSISDLLILREDNSIQALVIAGARSSQALIVSAGALTCLNRAELTALIAHEFGHIHNRDIDNNMHLSAILYAYFTVSEWRNGGRIELSAAIEHNLFRINPFRDSNGNRNTLGLLLGTLGLILHFYGRVVCCAYSRQRELMADARALEFTRERDSLIMVLKKSLALKNLGQNSQTQFSEFAHLFFLDNTKMRLFSSHPSIQERIEALGGKIYATEIYELEQKLKRPHQYFNWSE